MGHSCRHAIVRDCPGLTIPALLLPRRKRPAWANQVSGRFPQPLLVSSGLQRSEPDHYATLGLDRRCTDAQIRVAYRILAKRHHPDVNPASPDSMTQTQRINAAYEILSDPEQRNAYDLARDTPKARAVPSRTAKIDRNVSQDLHLKIEDFFRGTKLEVLVKDPANPNGAENYELVVPPDTAPGARFRLRRTAPFEGGFVNVRVRLQPGFRFKARGSDLRCDLRITTQRATQGGQETIVGATGSRVLVRIAPGVARGESLRIPGEGLPKPRGGRGDLLARITYRPEVRFSRPSGR